MKRLAGALLASLLCSQLTLVAGQSGGDGSEPELVRLATELEALSHGAALDSVARGIQALGPLAGASILEALSRDELPGNAGALPVGAHEREALLAGARLLGRTPFGPLLDEAASASDARRRVATIELIGAVGGTSDLHTAVLAATPAPQERPLPEALEALEQAAGALLKRDANTMIALRSSIAGAHPDLAGRLIRVVGTSGGAPALQTLGNLLDVGVPLELPILSQIERVARGLEPPFQEDLCARVRARLASKDRQLVRAAATALARLQDPQAVPDLLDLASSPDPALAGAAFQGLERITGLSLPRRIERWRTWFEEETSWALQRGAQIRAALSGHDPLQSIAALREIAQHRLDLLQLIELAASCLSSPDERVRVEACRTLGTLHSTLAGSALRRARTDPSPAVTAAAQEALRAAATEL